ncbi:MAG: tripartite tricarboxylate transporter substrate binding protein [Betaproteobacteria bacterium]|nr:tripartite tricarboxylate transporter substrate binding protein [Betaproteobacteria bacterium]
MLKRSEISSRSSVSVNHLAIVCFLEFACVANSAARAADYPVKPVRLVVPFAPGGSSDSVARMVGAKLTEAWGHQIVVENRPGASTQIGATHVARSTPDGYTLYLANANHTVNPALFKTLPYDPAKDFVSIVRLANQTVVLLVHPSVPAKSVKELIQLAKARPGELNFASPGVGTASHMTGVLFQTMAQINMVFVPYKGAGPSLVDLIAGQVTVGASGLTSSLQYIDSARLRALGVTTANRSVLKPDIPTIAESGIPGFEVTNWFGILAPAGTPAPVVEEIHQQVAKIMGQESNQQLIFRMGLEPSLIGPTKFGAFIQSEIEKWIRVVRETGIKAN